MMSVSAIATSVDNSALMSLSNMQNTEASQPAESATFPVSSLPPDTARVKKTDYIHGEHPEEYSMDLADPENLKYDEAEYVEKINMYKVGTKLGDNYLSAPTFMTPEQYLKWSERKSMDQYFRQRNDSLKKTDGKSKFDFTDMHFDLGPAEKIFGPGGVRVKTQGSAEVKFGYNYKFTDNPSLSERNRKTSSFDFDEKINISVNASVGDKMNFNINYNTDATFDFDSKNLKLAYEGKEDEIVKLIEAGNVTFPTNSSLIRGSSALFGFRTDLQFGKLKLQTVFSQKKSQSKSVSSEGGNQLSTFEIQAFNYDENRHFYLGHYFYNNYDQFCANLPNMTSGITIKRIEVWVTNTTGVTQNTRDLIAFADLGEQANISNGQWTPQSPVNPANSSNSLYSTIVQNFPDVRNVDQVSQLDGIMTGGVDYEKIENARQLTSSEYTLNPYLGYISLKSTLQSNQSLAVAYEYTMGGKTFQVGEFADDIKDNNQTLIVKLLKGTSNSPSMATWRLMMKNVYALNATSVQKEKFRLDIKYLCDTTGVYLNYLPEEAFKSTTLLKMMNLDRLDANDKKNPNGKFDFLEGLTVQASTGRVIFPVAEPFGKWLRKKIGSDAVADKYCYEELYDTTKTAARQIAEKNKYILTGEYKASSGSEINLGSYNIPQGSVTVTAGGVTLTEGSDYTVDYSLGKVNIINQSIIDAGTNVNVSLESQSEFQMMRKTMMGLNWTYDFSKNFQIGGTFLHLTEKPLTSKVAMGEEPLNNTIWGLNMNYKGQNQWLTNLIDKIPLIDVSAPSSINLNAEFAQLLTGQSKEVQGNASYIDDFEQTRSAISVMEPSEWIISSTPTTLEPKRGILNDSIDYGFGRALLAWYQIDPLFTRRSSSLTPSHIKSDANQLSNHYVREVYVREVYPNKETGYGESNTLPILNMAYYPTERGPYNLDTDVDQNGKLLNPKERWGGMMRKLDTSDFETSNVQYIEFWMMDPFIYSKDKANVGGKMYINLGDISEDILKDGKKSYESGMPVNDASTYTETAWGRVPADKSVVYSFSNEKGARQRQDIGLNGLNSREELTWGAYQRYTDVMRQKVTNQAALDSILNDPAGDDYHYFRGSDYDDAQVSVLDRYKRINGLEGNSPNSSESGESYSTAYKSTPDCEDVNQDYTMNEYENFYEYELDLQPGSLANNKYVVDTRNTRVTLRNGNSETCNWYLVRIPVEDYARTGGSISDFSSIRFMRIYLSEFEQPVILRFASLDLVRGEWRNYQQALYTGDKPSVSGTLVTSAINIEENTDKTPVNYVLPPGVSRIVDPSQPQLTQDNEQALAMTVTNLSSGDARAVYKTMNLDLRHYKHLQMFIHANALQGEQLNDKEMSVFVRIGSDYKSNYYEYEIPVDLTPEGHYDTYNATACEQVWPQNNMLDIDFEVLTELKHERNKAKAGFTKLFSQYDPNRPNNKVSIVGNPSLGEVKTMMIGVRNNSRQTRSVEVWVNELRMQDFSNEGGWAAQGSMNVQFSDLGSVNLTGHVETAGFGGLEDKVNNRRDDNLYEWSITTQLEFGKLFPVKWKMQLPFYYSYSWRKISPKYNPFDTDMMLKDALDGLGSKAEKDSLRSLTQDVTTNTNISFSNWKSNYQSTIPMPYDPANFAFSYAYTKKQQEGQTRVHEKEQTWKLGMQYNYSPKYKPLEPFKNMKTKSKWADIIKAQNLNWLPQSISFNTDLQRQYYELIERDIDTGAKLYPSFSDQILWNRDLAIRWDIFKSLKLNWTSATHAEIEEPYTVINKDLYPDAYSAWKDSVKRSIMSFGRPLNYKSAFTASYQIPLNKIPVLDWTSADASYNANYGWTRGTELDDGTSMGHTITTQRNVNLNGKLDFVNLYKKWKFLADTEARFSGSKTAQKKPANQSRNNRNNKKDTKDTKADDKKKKGFNQEVTLNDSTFTEVKHGQNTKRIIVRATTKEGRSYYLKYKKVDANTIKVLNQDTAVVKISVIAKEPLEDKGWYKTAQVVARGLMLVRNFSVSYRNTYALTLPGFRTEVGDAFGQKTTNGLMSPGLDFAFGLVGDSYIDKAASNGWLMQNDSNITTPATTNAMEDLQLKATLEPFRDFKIDLNASRTVNKANSVQFMYDGMPRTMSGSFNMTTVSIATAFAKNGNIDNNYDSKPFNTFLQNLDVVQQRLEQKYAGTVYPAMAGEYAGKKYEGGGINKYSADVMIPAFLAAYCGNNAASSPLDIFPTIKRLLPNWTIKYSGMVKLPWFRDNFKSFNLNHAYKSVYSVGAYNSYTSFMEYMGDMGFVTDVKTGVPMPSSIYNVSTVSINESFAPLIGFDATLNNGITAKIEYKKTRTLNLSMTSIALTENYSNDFVFGFGYKIKDLNLFGAKKIQSTEPRSKKNSKGKKNDDDSKSNQKTNSRTKGGISHDLNLRCDISYRMQNALNRNIQTAVSTSTNGNVAWKVAINADYTFSRLLTLSGFLDWQRNIPLVAQSSYPTTTADFGINIKFSLTR